MLPYLRPDNWGPLGSPTYTRSLGTSPLLPWLTSSGLGAACRVGVWVLVRGSPSPVRGFFLAEEQGTLGQ